MYAVWTWYSCRDVFHADFLESNHMFVYHKGHSLLKLRKYLNNIESLLQIDDKSTFYKTVRKSASLIILSEFWYDQMAFNLLTILLRHGIDHRKVLFDPNKKSTCGLINETHEAIKLFFGGKTHYNGDKVGWHEQFAGLSKSEAEKYLN
jgi:hypothetical protein